MKPLFFVLLLFVYGCATATLAEVEEGITIAEEAEKVIAAGAEEVKKIEKE